ncbi:MAG: hypothetical protein H0V67_03985 [Geodermatophilaceae bacterium]|nr:hypothetical protein [Geodermatophilaceae bacterium]
MSTFTANWRQRRRNARNQREIAQAISRAPSQSLREELLVLTNRGDQLFR